MSNTDNSFILPPRQTWFVYNVTNQTLVVTDISSIPPIKPGEKIDLLTYSSFREFTYSRILRNYINKNWLIPQEYLHTHDDKSYITHLIPDHIDTVATGAQLNTLTGKKNADDLHEHARVGDVTLAELQTLTNGSNADELHVHDHNNLINIDGGEAELKEYYHLGKDKYTNLIGIDATGVEINQALQGISETVLAINLDTLTNESDADELHGHNQFSKTDGSRSFTEVVGGIIPTEDAHLATKKYVDDQVVAEDFWDRSDSTLYPSNTGDNISTTGLGTFGSLDVDTLNLNGNVISDSTGTISFSDDNIITTGNIILDSSVYRFYLGEYQEASIYFDECNLILSNNDVSLGCGIILDGDVEITGNLTIEGSLEFVPYVGATKDVDLGTHNLTTTGLGTFGSLDVDTLNLNGNVISDSTGTISFDDDNLITVGDINIDSYSSRLYFGKHQEASIYFDKCDLILSNNDPSWACCIKIDGCLEITSNINFGSKEIYIEEEDGNLVFSDSIAGSITLSDMDCPKIIYASGDLVDSVTTAISNSINWNVNKSIIQHIKIETDSTDWDLTIFCDSSGGIDISSGGIFDSIQLVANGVGELDLEMNLPYIDNDSNNSVYFQFVDNAGDAGTKDCYVYGIKAR